MDTQKNTIELSRGLLGGLLGGLVVSLMAVAFLMGRETKQQPVAAAPAPAVTARPAPEAPGSQSLVVQEPPLEAPPAQAVPVAAPLPATVPVATAPAPVAAAPPAPRRQPVQAARPAAVPAAPAAPQPEPAPVVSQGDRAKISDYLAKVDRITAGTPDLGDPNRFATNLLNQAMAGDTSELDQLITSSRESKQQMLAIEAPSACREHHRLSVRVLDGGISLLQSLKSAMKSGDTSALTALASRGRSMQDEADRLRQITEQLRQPQ